MLVNLSIYQVRIINADWTTDDAFRRFHKSCRNNSEYFGR